jgi:pimeloyl-ACP methyl ester carboxylesterase
MEKKYLSTPPLTWHYRVAGQGKPVVLLHPSPRSGRMFEPLGKFLSDTCQVIIPDLPGYGETTAIPETVSSLYDVVVFLDEFLEALGHSAYTLYGSATGAQLGIAYALTHPEKVSKLLLDNCAHFSEESYQKIVDRYFIDLNPQADGRHLTLLWEHVQASTEFFPWFEKLESNRIAPQPMPAAMLQDTVTDYLKAGPRYAELYRAAFLHERAEKVQALEVDTVLFRWKGSILLKAIDTLLSFPMPSCVKVVESEADMADRYQKIKSNL